MDTQTKDLILYIVGCLQEMEADTSTMRVIKLLYLVDVESCRTYGQRATELNWIYYRYGPYAMAFPKIFRSLDLDMGEEEYITSAGHRGRSYSLKIPLQEVESRLPDRIRRIADRLLKVLGLENLNEILDYVYFHTEPMTEAEFGDTLDFSTVERRTPDLPILVRFSSKKAKEFRARLAETLAEPQEEADIVEVHPYRDEAYYKAIAEMDADDVTPRLCGKRLAITPEALRSLRKSKD